jgi:hypothetical protein
MTSAGDIRIRSIENESSVDSRIIMSSIDTRYIEFTGRDISPGNTDAWLSAARPRILADANRHDEIVVREFIKYSAWRDHAYNSSFL